MYWLYCRYIGKLEKLGTSLTVSSQSLRYLQPAPIPHVYIPVVFVFRVVQNWKFLDLINQLLPVLPWTRIHCNRTRPPQAKSKRYWARGSDARRDVAVRSRARTILKLDGRPRIALGVLPACMVKHRSMITYRRVIRHWLLNFLSQAKMKNCCNLVY